MTDFSHTYKHNLSLLITYMTFTSRKCASCGIYPNTVHILLKCVDIVTPSTTCNDIRDKFLACCKIIFMYKCFDVHKRHKDNTPP